MESTYQASIHIVFRVQTKNCSFEDCLKKSNEGRRTMGWFVRLLEKSNALPETLGANSFKRFTKRQDKAQWKKLDHHSFPSLVHRNPWWNAPLKELKMKSNNGNSNYNNLTKYNLLMNYIFKLHM